MKKLLLTIIPFFLGIVLNAQIVYVDVNATGTNDGSSWANAFTDLQSATFFYPNGTEIWVAQGTYKPSRSISGGIPTDPKDNTFRIVNNIQVYGGFNGTETMRSQRDWFANLTILSGALGAGNYASHVVRFNNNTNSTVFDGFTVSDGYATAGSPVEHGGGMYLENSSNPIIQNCIFKNNKARQHGGAIYKATGDANIYNCEFTNNSTELYDGGAIYLNTGSSVTIAGCLFNGNVAARYSGAMHFQDISNT